MIKKLFTYHPNEINETYFQHLIYASKTACRLFFASIALLIHSIFPFLFTHTASGAVIKVYASIVKRLKT